MTELHRVLLGTLLNSLWQIPLLYAAAWISARLLRRSSLLLQHRLWVATLLLGVTVPILGALGWFRSLVDRFFLHARASTSSSASPFAETHAAHSASISASSPFLAFSLANALLALWFAWVVFRVVTLLWSLARLQALARAAVPSHTVAAWGDLPHQQHLAVEVLLSDQLKTPATLGILRPVVLVPRSLAGHACESDLAALFFHELAHVSRHDFLLNLLHEIVTIPISFHPTLRRIRSHIADTRELLCDQLAAREAGGTHAYAYSLLQLAELLLLDPSTPPTPALGLLEGQNLEHRVMSLLDHSPRPARGRTAVLCLASLALLAPCCLAAATFTFQPAAIAAADLQPYAGTWHWLFNGKSFVTMQLVPAGDHFTGYMTNGFIKNDASGNMTDAGSEPGRSAIVRTFFSGKVLHIVVEYDKDKTMSEWTMTLTDPNKAQFNSADPDAPKQMKPWTAERVDAK